MRPKAEGYYKPLGAVMDGLVLDNYSYGYAGYSCGYAGGRYWPGQGCEGSAESQSGRGEHATSHSCPMVEVEVANEPRSRDEEKKEGEGEGGQG